MLKLDHFFNTSMLEVVTFMTTLGLNKGISQSLSVINTSMRPRDSPSVGWGVLRAHRDTHGWLKTEPNEVTDYVLNSFIPW